MESNLLPAGLRNGYVKNIIKNNENIWIGTPNGLQIVDYKSKNIVQKKHPMGAFFKEILQIILYPLQVVRVVHLVDIHRINQPNHQQSSHQSYVLF